LPPNLFLKLNYYKNIFTNRREYSDALKQIKKDIITQEAYISKARKFFLEEKIDLYDFSKLKKGA